ncbi:sialidase family protein [Dactylosporangium darangshiense]|uniref:exo-alpha-sialidase n=1 Tax=Dactylosporangium darangshiense TaxID=579108 RepID=A0ABP8DJK1_9ACTN
MSFVNRAVLAGAVAVVLTAAAVPGPAAASVSLSTSKVGVQQVLFRSGTAGYGCFRIPALLRTKAGSLLAFAEARKSPTCADRGEIDLVVRRSTNNGRTWGPIRLVLSGSDTDPAAPYTRGNPAPVVDMTTGRILLVTTSNPATLSGKRLPWVQSSDDDGLTWSAARAMNVNFSGSDSGWFATGPSHGIQLTTGAHAGRLVVGAHQQPNSTTVNAGVLYSDDHGDTWHASVAANSFVEGVMNPGEVSVAELPDGSVYAAARNQIGSTGNHRARAVSADGGDTMPAFTAVPSLVSPDVEGAVLTLRSTYQSKALDTMLFSGPSNPTTRNQLQIRYSTDKGVTWKSPAGGLVTDERSGYSDLAELTDGEIGVLYEGGATTDELGNTGFSADEIRFVRFTPAQLGLPGTFTGVPWPQASPAAAASTPDVTGEANDALLRGNAALAAGRFGQGLTLDGAGDYAEIPYARTIDPGAGDFTYSLWFNYQATAASPQQVLLWGYGFGAGEPQLWLRAQPAQDRLYAWVEGVGGRAEIALPDPSAATAFGDGAWHHLSLVRAGAQATLTVDGAVTGSATGLSGSVTGSAAGGVDGLRLGSRPDGTATEAFAGSLDEFRLYRTALGTGQLDQVRANADVPGAALGVRLPFQVIDGATVPTRVKVAVEDDMSGHCATATLLGGAPSLVAGHVNDKALAVNTAHPGVEAPFVPTLDVGAGDFTFTTWLQYSATSASPNQVLFWAYGMGADTPQVWLRAQPAQDRLYAWVETAAGPVGVALPDSSSATAFGNGAWHAVTLTRTGGQVRLAVDGAAATATGLTGSITAGHGLSGLRLGSRLDGADVLAGNLDEFRVYRRALTPAETTALAGGAYPGDNPAVRWTFESGYTQAHNVVRPSPASGPTTYDATVHCNTAYVRGGAQPTTAGRFGAALAFDGVDDAVQVPYSSATAIGAGDFTVSFWLRYASGAGDQVLLWAYGVGAANRQLWLRASPSRDGLYAAFETDAATTMLTATDASAAVAFGDNQWHHVALSRAGGTLSLSVDGVALATGTAPPGSATYGDAFAVDGLQLGAKPGGGDQFKGSLDEFRVFRRSLTAAEADDVRVNNADLGTVTSVRLPFEVVGS